MVEVTELDDHKCQFLYKNDGQLHLMDPETFEMYEVPESIMEGEQNAKESQAHTSAFYFMDKQ